MPTRFLGGLSTVKRGEVLGQYYLLDPSTRLSYFQEFLDFVPENFLTTVVGTGVYAGASGRGGISLSTTSATSTHSVFTMPKGSAVNGLPTWNLVVGKKTFFKARFRAGDGNGTGVTTMDAITGMHTISTTPLSATNAIWFRKAAAAVGVVDFVVKYGATTVSIPVGQLGLSTDYHVVGFFHDGVLGNRMQVWFDNNKFSVPVGHLTGASMSLGWGVETGASSAATHTLDYIFAGGER